MEAGRWPLCLALLERMREEKARERMHSLGHVDSVSGCLGKD